MYSVSKSRYSFVFFIVVFILNFFILLAPASAEKITKEEYDARVNAEEDANTKFLLSKVLNKAKALQEAYGDFAPFAAGLFPNGEVKFVWLAKPGETVSDPLKALAILRQTLKEQAKAGRLLGSGVAYKFRAQNSALTQINVELEYFSKYAKLFSVSLVADEGKKIAWGGVKEAPYEAEIFNFEDK